jgi:hypothetical protein
MGDADRLLLRLVDVCRSGIGLTCDVHRTATDDRATAGSNAELGQGHFHRHIFVLFINASSGGVTPGTSIGIRSASIILPPQPD